MSKKVVIVGSGGRLGKALVRKLSSIFEITGFARPDLDVCELDQIHAKIGALEFDALIYAAGLTAVDYCEDHQEEAFLANEKAPQALAQICQGKGAKLIHFSTDYVFNGENPNPLKEDESPHPVSVYGESKCAGENAVLEVNPKFLVIRVSWVFGPDRPSFPDMILQRALGQDVVEAISDKVSCPAYTEDLAEWLIPMITEDKYQGLLHLSNSGPTTWQNYGQRTLEIAKELGIPVKTTQVNGILRSELTAFKAIRPQYTSFDTSKFTELSGITPRSWEDAIRDYLAKHYQHLISA